MWGVPFLESALDFEGRTKEASTGNRPEKSASVSFRWVSLMVRNPRWELHCRDTPQVSALGIFQYWVSSPPSEVVGIIAGAIA